jgi:hypothetical protein
MKINFLCSTVLIGISIGGCANVPERSFTNEYANNPESITASLRNAMQKCWYRNPIPFKDGFMIEEGFKDGKHVFEAHSFASDGRGPTRVLLAVESIEGKARVLYMQPELRGAFSEKRDEDDELLWQDMKRWANGDYTCR